MNYTYILECADGTLYCGWTNNLDKRLKAHNEGKGAKYTRSRLPVTLAYYEAYATSVEAQRREYKIKTLTRKQKEALFSSFKGNDNERRVTIYGSQRQEEIKKFREACRGVIVDGDKVLLSYESGADLWLFPGGGLEGTELPCDCCKRELSEEAGFSVNPLKHYLTISEYDFYWHHITHYFICEITGKVQRHLTALEEKLCLEPMWVPIEKALEIFSSHTELDPETDVREGMYRREYVALLEYLRYKKTEA